MKLIYLAFVGCGKFTFNLSELERFFNDILIIGAVPWYKSSDGLIYASVRTSAESIRIIGNRINAM